MYECPLCALVRGTPDLRHAALLEAELSMAARDGCPVHSETLSEQKTDAQCPLIFFCVFYS